MPLFDGKPKKFLLTTKGLYGFWYVLRTYHRIKSAQDGVATPTGTVMLAVLPIVIGVQLLLAFLAYDIENVPRRRIHKRHLLKSYKGKYDE